jgi:hypothetical protein
MSFAQWDVWRAEEELRDRARDEAQQRFNSEAGPCPNCGAAADVAVVDVTSFGQKYAFAPSVARCSARCDLLDPLGYLKAIQAQR